MRRNLIITGLLFFCACLYSCQKDETCETCNIVEYDSVGTRLKTQSAGSFCGSSLEAKKKETNTFDGKTSKYECK